MLNLKVTRKNILMQKFLKLLSHLQTQTVVSFILA